MAEQVVDDRIYRAVRCFSLLSLDLEYFFLFRFDFSVFRFVGRVKGMRLFGGLKI